MRLKILLSVLVLAILHTVAFKVLPSYAAALNALAFRYQLKQSAVGVLERLGLDATPDNIDLYMTVREGVEPPKDGWASRLQPIPCEAVPPTRADARFSEHWTYADLLDDEVIEIGVFMQRALAWPDLKPLLEASKAQWVEHGIVVHIAESEEAFRKALSDYDIALFFGHSNLGQGMDFNHGPINMGSDTLEIPFQHLSPDHEVLEEIGNGLFRVTGGADDLAGLNIQNKLFAYMGCRSNGYYRDVLERQFPGRDYLLTHYVWSATIHAPEIIRQLVHGLELGQSLETITQTLNQGHEMDILWGRLKEVHMYKNAGPYSPDLFSLE